MKGKHYAAQSLTFILPNIQNTLHKVCLDQIDCNTINNQKGNSFLEVNMSPFLDIGDRNV